jgi:hypothetical protein
MGELHRWRLPEAKPSHNGGKALLKGEKDASAPEDAGAVSAILKVCIGFLVWQIHKSIAGVVGSHVGSLQPGKVDNQSVVALPLVVFRWIERRPPTVGRYPGAYLWSLG